MNEEERMGYVLAKMEELAANMRELKEDVKMLKDQVSTYKTAIKTVKFMVLILGALATFKFGDLLNLWKQFFHG